MLKSLFVRHISKALSTCAHSLTWKCNYKPFKRKPNSAISSSLSYPSGSRKYTQGGNANTAPWLEAKTAGACSNFTWATDFLLYFHRQIALPFPNSNSLGEQDEFQPLQSSQGTMRTSMNVHYSRCDLWEACVSKNQGFFTSAKLEDQGWCPGFWLVSNVTLTLIHSELLGTA